MPWIVQTLAGYGVVGAFSFGAYSDKPVVWLVTRTDAEKALVEKRGFFRDVVCQLLLDAGLPADLSAATLVTVESDETVDRDFGGDWWPVVK